MTDVLQGFRSDKDANTAQAALSDLFYTDMAGRDVTLQSAANYRTLRSKGITVRKTIDVLIGAFCIANDHVLLHADQDFGPMQTHLGLRCA